MLRDKSSEADRRLFESLLQAAPDAIIVVDSAGLIRIVNRQVETLFGYTPAELIGQSVDMLVPLRVRDVHPQRRASYMRDPRTRPMGAGLNLSARRKDGSEFPVDISLSAIHTKEGPLVSAAIRDISERKVAEQRNRLAAIVDASSDAIVGQNLDGIITSWNPAAERLYGYSAGEAIGKNISMIYPPESDELARTTEKLGRGERVEGSETFRVTKDGIHLDVLVSIYPIRDEQGRVVGTAAITRDMTERVAATKQRTRLEAELQQSQRLESVGQLAGGIAHDFNNLIAVIMNYATFVSDELDDRPELKADVEEIHRAAERAAGLTRQLLIFSRRELPHPEIIDLNSVVNEMRKLLQRTIGEHIELVTRIADDLWSVTADRGQIEQVIMNLAVNARDAMPHGGRLVIETSMDVVDDEYVAAAYVSLAPGRYVRLTVADTGTGMTPEVADRAFEPFFTTKPKGKGTGLGLATVYGIVSQSGGKVSLYSEPGRGTRVNIHIPAIASASVGPPTEVPHQALKGHGEHILLVEDESAVRVAARRILQSHGYSVFDAPTPAAAIQAASDPSRIIDLVLTDVVMPEMSGLELAARLTATRPSLRVVYMSGYPQEVIAHQGLLTAELRLIEKPFSRDALLRAVAEALAGTERP